MYGASTYVSPIGELTLVCSGKALVGLWIEGQKYFGGGLSWSDRGELPLLKQAKGWLDRYFAGERPEISELPLAPEGSAFRQEVWKLLCEIPYGQVTTYGELAGKMAAKQGKTVLPSRAVGGAVAHNPISIIIPCHRVVGSGGALTGYAGGVDRKRKLLEHEGAVGGK